VGIKPTLPINLHLTVQIVGLLVFKNYYKLILGIYISRQLNSVSLLLYAAKI